MVQVVVVGERTRSSSDGEMGLQWEEVEAALKEPEFTYPSEITRRMAVRGRLAVAYDPADRVVVTVLWNGRSGRDAA